MNNYKEKYPWLRVMNLYTGKINENADPFDEIPDGWKNTFGDMLLEELNAVIRKADLVDKFVILQMKEKFGGLRLYHNQAGNDEIQTIIDKYSVISSHVCVKCGSPNSVNLDIDWIRPLCKECFVKENDGNTYEGLTYEELGRNSIDMPTKITYKKFHDNNIPRENLDYDMIEIDISDTVKKIKENYQKNAD